MQKRYFNAVLTEEDGMFVSLNPDTGIVSQGSDINEAVDNLREALKLYFEELDDKSQEDNLSHQSFLTTVSL